MSKPSRDYSRFACHLSLDALVSQVYALLLTTMLACVAFSVEAEEISQTDGRDVITLGRQLQVGDLVFIRIPHVPFTKVADTTQSWTNHVGIVIDTSGVYPVIAESRVPVSGETGWQHFVDRSENGRVAIRRPRQPLTRAQNTKLSNAARSRYGRLYDTGFDLHSRGEFCSRFVREVLFDATGIQVGRVENFKELFTSNPQSDLTFWKTWFFGYIPWRRETVTPASQLVDDHLSTVFDGNVSSTNNQKLTGEEL